LQSTHADDIESLIASNEIETGRGANQIGTLQRVRDTRWSSHFHSICRLITMFNASCSVLNVVSNDGANYSQCGDADAAYMVLTSFEFILILMYKFIVLARARVVYNIMVCKCEVKPIGNCVLQSKFKPKIILF
jgi:hypothetical protein